MYNADYVLRIRNYAYTGYFYSPIPRPRNPRNRPKIPLSPDSPRIISCRGIGIPNEFRVHFLYHLFLTSHNFRCKLRCCFRTGESNPGNVTMSDATGYLVPRRNYQLFLIFLILILFFLRSWHWDGYKIILLLLEEIQIVLLYLDKVRVQPHPHTLCCHL